MIIRMKATLLLILVIHVAVTLFFAHRLFHVSGIKSLSTNSNIDAHTLNRELVIERESPYLNKPVQPSNTTRHVVEIWGKAAIGLYLWEHIFDADLVPKLNGVWSYGEQKVDEILFRFRTGPGVVPQKVPQDLSHLVLVLNGRTSQKVDSAKSWLDLLPQFRRLQRVVLVLLGNEKCENQWLTPYLSEHGGFVGAVFVVYDSTEVDDVTFFQWPLGVATYRSFTRTLASGTQLTAVRPYTCSFLATIYPNSSREHLLDILKHNISEKICYVKPRMAWLDQETIASRQDYLWSLQHSDLVLSPVGQNCECYRLYEALAHGAVPVVEAAAPRDGRCARGTCLRLLHTAPLLRVSHWGQLPALLAREALLTPRQRADRRRAAVLWYRRFKALMKNRFVDVVRKTFRFQH